MTTKILRGKEIDEYIKNNPSADIKFLDPEEFAKGRKVVIDYHEGDQGFLGNLARDLVRPFYNTYRGLTGQLTEKEKQNLDRFWLSNILGIGSTLIPGGALAKGGIVGLGRVVGAGALSGALQAASKADIAKPIDPLEVAAGAVAGGVTSGALGLAGKTISNVIPKLRLREVARPKTVEEIEDALVNLAQQNKITPKVNPFGQYTSNVSNPIRNLGLSLTMRGLAVKGGPLNKINSIGDKQFNESVIKNIFSSLGGLKSPSDIQAVVSALPKAREKVLQALDDKMGPSYNLSQIINETTKQVMEKGVPATKEISEDQIKKIIIGDIKKALPSNPDVAKMLNPKNNATLKVGDVQKVVRYIDKKIKNAPETVSPGLKAKKDYFENLLQSTKGQDVSKVVQAITKFNSELNRSTPLVKGTDDEVKQKVVVALQKILKDDPDIIKKAEKGGTINLTTSLIKKGLDRISRMRNKATQEEKEVLDLVSQYFKNELDKQSFKFDISQTPDAFTSFRISQSTIQPSKTKVAKNLTINEKEQIKKALSEALPDMPELPDIFLGNKPDVKLNNSQLAGVIAALEASKNQSSKVNREMFEVAENYLRRLMNETIKDPSYSNINTAYATLYDIVPEVRQGMNQVQEVSQAGIIPPIWDIVGKKTATLAGGTLQRLANTIESPVSRGSAMMLAQAGRAPFSSPQRSSLALPPEILETENPQEIAEKIIRIYEQPKIDRMQAFSQALAITQNVPQAIQLANFLSEPPRKIGAEERQMITRASYGLAGVNGIRNILKNGNINNLGLQNLLAPGILNIAQTPEAQLFRLYTDQISEAIGRLMSGGAITANEEARFKRMIPTFGDKPETINAKLNELETMFTQLLPNK
jgi:hypothetical protein